MNTFRDAVVSDDKAFEQRNVVEQSARARSGGDAAQPFDDVPFAPGQSRAGLASLAIASSKPFTKPLSRLS